MLASLNMRGWNLNFCFFVFVCNEVCTSTGTSSNVHLAGAARRASGALQGMPRGHDPASRILYGMSAGMQVGVQVELLVTLT